VTNDRNETIVLNGVLVGEVWFSSGQSNMVWVAGKSMCNEIAREIAGSKEDIPIREINIDTVFSAIPAKARNVQGRLENPSERQQLFGLIIVVCVPALPGTGRANRYPP
jgi:hypothetical protein